MHLIHLIAQPTNLLGPVDLRWAVRVVSHHYCLVSMPHLSPGNCHLTSVLCCAVTQSCLTLCDLMDSSRPGSSVHGDSPGKNTVLGCHALLQGIFPALGSNPGLPLCRWLLQQLMYQGSPVLCLVSYSQLSPNNAHCFLSVITRIRYPATQMIFKSTDQTVTSLFHLNTRLQLHQVAF